MNKRFVFSFYTGLTILAACAFNLKAEFRDPSLCELGPMRYFFEEPSEKISMRWFSSFYTKWAQKSFTEKHGRNLQELPALLFGKDEFRMCTILPNCLADLSYENYHPLLRTHRLRLRAEYAEVGFVFGVSADYPLSLYQENTGRIGFRVTLPFKRCKITKNDNEGIHMGAQLQDVVAIQSMRVDGTEGLFDASENTTTNPVDWLGNSDAIAIRLDLLEALEQDPRTKSSFINYARDTTLNEVGVTAGSSRISFNAAEKTAFDGLANDDDATYAQFKHAMIYCPEGQIPSARRNFSIPSQDAASYKELPKDANIKNSTGYYYFKNSPDTDPLYKNLADQADSKSVEQRVLDQDSKASVWMIPIAVKSLDTAGNPSLPYILPSGTPLYSAKALVETINGNEYTWLKRRGLNFENFTADKMGDLSVEVFLEQGIANFASVEIGLSVTAPTGEKATYKNNPYQIYSGNGGHWEFGPKGGIAFKASDMFSARAHGRYMWVRSATEERAATFIGSKIKNIGPKMEADVTWQYFVGNVDLNFTHPGTAAITGLIGYEFFYKRKESIKYAKKEMESWLGRRFVAPSAGAEMVGSLVTANAKLDEELASMNTNAITHKIKFEASYLLSGWLEFFWSGAWAFAGKNAPASISGQCGFHVAF